MALAKDKPTPAEINRRTLIASGAVTLVAPLWPVAAQAATETPVMALFREWQEIDRESRAFFAAKPVLADDDPRSMAFVQRKEAVERKMFEAPKRDMIDLALTIMCASDFGLFGLQKADAVHCQAEARALVGA